MEEGSAPLPLTKLTFFSHVKSHHYMGCCVSSRSSDDVFDLKSIELKDTKKFIPPIKFGKVVKVYDGDTFTIATSLSVSAFSKVPSKPEYYRFSVRMRGIDTPELKTKNPHEKEAADKAQQALSLKIKDRVVELKNVEYDKYVRILADVYLEGEHINQWMLKNKHAVPYDGGTKPIYPYK